MPCVSCWYLNPNSLYMAYYYRSVSLILPFLLGIIPILGFIAFSKHYLFVHNCYNGHDDLRTYLSLYLRYLFPPLCFILNVFTVWCLEGYLGLDIFSNECFWWSNISMEFDLASAQMVELRYLTKSKNWNDEFGIFTLLIVWLLDWYFGFSLLIFCWSWFFVFITFLDPVLEKLGKYLPSVWCLPNTLWCLRYHNNMEKNW